MSKDKVSKAASIMAKKAGEKRKKEGGPTVFSDMGKKLAAERGPEYYRELNRKSQAAKARAAGKLTLESIPKGAKILAHELMQIGDGSAYIIFNHLDGMYSHCTTEKGETVHLSRQTPLKKAADAYRLDEDRVTKG